MQLGIVGKSVRTGGATVLFVAILLATSAQAVLRDGPPAGGRVAPDQDAVIIELTAPPVARGSAARSRALGVEPADVQRTRMRQAIVALENQHRATRGLSTRSAAAVIRHEYGVVFNGFAARLSGATVAALRKRPDVYRVVPDGRVHAFLDVSVPVVRAGQVWQDFGYRGAGTTIAVIDTGVDYTQPDLGGCLGATCKVAGGYDFVNDDTDPRDDHGHGTHVAATAAGKGVFLGVAPDATVLAYKVLDASGSGSFSDVMAGIERAADPNGDGNTTDHATIISMSLGGGGNEDDPMSTTIDNATAASVLSVIAAGNAGDYFTIGSPGTARTALTVGATDDTDAIAPFSSRGPTTIAFLLKPEITAPGVAICAAIPPGAFAGAECVGTTHASISGTSMATPHVSGAAALLRGLHPSLPPMEIKAMLQEGAKPLPLDLSTGGAGRLDARAAADVTTILSPAPVNLGVNGDVDPIWVASATVTVRNLAAAAKTYVLSVPAGGFPSGVTATVTPASVTVAPGLTEAVTLEISVDNAVVPESTSPPYIYSGLLLATAGSEQEAILVSFAKPETHKMVSGRTLVVRDRGGDASKRMLSAISKDVDLSPGRPGSANDPTRHGARFGIANAASGETETFFLPALNWVGLGNPAGASGYRYSDPDFEFGPCKSAQISHGSVKVKCHGSQIDFSLDEPAQQELGLKLTSGNRNYCMVFGGTIKLDKPATGTAMGVFKAVNASRPADCPFVPSDSCQGNCGTSAGYCYCDAVCQEFGDCCQDYEDFCSP